MTEHYPNSEPDTLGELKQIERLPGMKAVAPNISWGQEYQSWPLERRLHYAERLASTMNHAADVLQQSRAQITLIAQQQQEMLQAANQKLEAQGRLLQEEMVRADARYQEIAQQLVSAQAEVKRLTQELKRYTD